ncbi:MAG: helix-hairpin-helix domain-containing protein [Victivallis sp.]
MKTIEAKILQILWPRLGVDNPRSWYRLECQTETGTMICTGTIKWRPTENELLKLTGDFEVWKGQQCFKFAEARPNVPENPRAQLSYVVERTKGMGPATEAAIWDSLGDGWRKLSPKEAEALKIRPDVYEIFKQQLDSLVRDKEKCDAISYLIGRGCSNALACAAWEAWETDAVGIVNSDCYRLADLSGFGFADVDGKVRLSYDIGDEDPRRIKAAIIYAMRQLTGSGSTVISWVELVQKLGELKINLQLAQAAVGNMFDDFTLRGFAGEEMVALGFHYNAETEILNYLGGKHE